MSSNTTIAPDILGLQSATRYTIATVGSVLFIGGITENLLTILTFYMLGHWKHNASSLYLLVKSLADLFCLFFGLLLTVLSIGFQINLVIRSIVSCKLRLFLSFTTFLISQTCVCFHSIDAFLCSSPSAAVRSKSNVRVARYLIIGCLVVWIGQSTPFIFFQNLIPRGNTFVCVTQNAAYVQYMNIFLSLCVYAVIPITFISVFTYRNLRISTIQRGRLLSSISRQMISMALVQIGDIMLFELPLGIVLTYHLATSNFVKSSYRQAQEQVAAQLVYVFSYGPIAVNAYTF